ncbi:MAG: NAD(P)-binding protein [Anaerolineae bacterium]|nr:NAD(P)-binding protein [Anaerolineae bacterium]
MNIAVIGSGIAGLTAGYLLSQKHTVTLYERQPTPGMDAFSVDLEGGVRLDVPMRLNYPGYYRALLAMYAHLGIETQRLQANATFLTPDGHPYFRFSTRRLGPLALPQLDGEPSGQWSAGQIAADAWRLAQQASHDLASGTVGNVTLEDYLAHNRYSADLAEGFLYPFYATISTCAYATVRNMPAQVILETLNPRILLSGFRTFQRVKHGTQAVVKALTQPIQSLRLSTTVEAVCRVPGGVQVVENNGASSVYDHAIIATQANHALKLVADANPAERSVLHAFPYESCEVVIHTDANLLPPCSRDWAQMNFVVGSEDVLPTATGWMNPAYPELAARPPIFHTLNPASPIDPAHIIDRTWFERATLSPTALPAWQTLQNLHNERGRQLWFVGAYATPGLALQENAAESAVQVALRLGVAPPWER